MTKAKSFRLSEGNRTVTARRRSAYISVFLKTQPQSKAPLRPAYFPANRVTGSGG